MTSIKDTVRQDIERAENIQSENKYEQVLARCGSSRGSKENHC